MGPHPIPAFELDPDLPRSSVRVAFGAGVPRPIPDRPLRVLLVHNEYAQNGGEESVFRAEADLLETAGHQVHRLLVSNEEISGFSAKVSTALRATYNPAARRYACGLIREFRPDIVHVHNLFPLISPSIFDACEDLHVPVIWTLHNFRIACSKATLFRDDKPCEDCLSSSPWPAVLNRCYRGSLAGSLTVASMIWYHRRWAGTWAAKVDRFVAVSQFARSKLLLSGLPPDRLIVKPHFVRDPGVDWTRPRFGAIYVGRLSNEKGVSTLLRAWQGIPNTPLTIVGDGPEMASLRAMAPANVAFVGRKSREEVEALVAQAAVLVCPSQWYETFGLVVVEAMAAGTPAIVSAIGALPELVERGVDGLHTAPGDAESLRRTVLQAFAEPETLRRMGRSARNRYLREFSPARNLSLLTGIYRSTISATMPAQAAE